MTYHIEAGDVYLRRASVQMRRWHGREKLDAERTSLRV